MEAEGIEPSHHSDRPPGYPVRKLHSIAVLNGKLALYDVRDVEALAASIVQRAQPDLGFHDREDLVAELVETAWELSLGYQRGDTRFPPRFSVYVTPILKRRVVDWQRRRFGRTRWQFKDRVYERPAVTVHSLDQMGGSALRGVTDGPDTADLDFLRVFGARDSTSPRRETKGVAGTDKRAA